MIGSTIDGRYRILRELGAGAMGAVYEAEHTGTGGRVAVKVITGDFKANTDALSRFQREARAAGVVETQYVTKVYDTGIDRESGLPFLVMEFLTGQDLQGFLKLSAPIAPDLALRIIAQACMGLQKAHEAKVVHRDIKPANIFLARREEGEVIVKLVDFGIAKVKMEQAQETGSAGLTKTGSLLGSPLYMSPEQALGSKDVDHRSDLWSLGITLYHALTGRTPFQHITALGQLIVEISYGRLAPVQELAPWVSPEVAAVVHGALRRIPAERFQSATEMLSAIRPLLPNGFGIHESMLKPLQAAAQAQVQPRLPMSSMPLMPSHPDLPTPALIPEPPRSQPAMNASATADGMARSHAAARPSPVSSTPLIVAVSAGLLTLAGLGVGGFYFLRKPPPAPVVEATLPTIETAVTPVAPPSPPPVAPSASVAALQEVPVTILPKDAFVEVDDQPVPVKHGMFMLAGAPGSSHRVRVFKAKYETTVNVTITDDGAKPEQVVMSYSGSRSSGAAPTTPGAATAPGRKTKFD